MQKHDNEAFLKNAMSNDFDKNAEGGVTSNLFQGAANKKNR
jgi:hypothetical protein